MRVPMRIAAFFLATVAMAAHADDRNVIPRISVQETATGASVRIAGSRAPTFTQFTLADPDRVVIDLSGAVLAGPPAELRGKGPTVRAVRTAMFESGAVSVARVTVELAVEGTYDLHAEGTDLVLGIRSIGPAPQPVAAAPAAVPVDDAKVADAEAREAQARRAASRSAEEAGRAEAALGRAEAERTAAETASSEAEAKARAEATARAEAERKAQELAQRIDAAERAEQEAIAKAESARKAAELARLDAEHQKAEAKKALEDAKARLEAATAAREEAERRAHDAQARADAAEAARKAALEKLGEADASHEALARAEAARVEAERRAQSEAEARAESERRAQEAQARADAAERARREAEAKAEALRAAGPTLVDAQAGVRSGARYAQYDDAESYAREGAVHVTSTPKVMQLVGFKVDGGVSRVFVRTNEAVQYKVNEEGDTVYLDLDNTRATAGNDLNFLDTRFFDTAIQVIAPEEIEGAGTHVRIAIRLKQRVPFKVTQQDNEIDIDFQHP